MTESTTPVSAVDARALAHLHTLLGATGATWASEQQWRAYCDSPEHVRPHEFEDMIDHEGKPVLGHDGRARQQPVDLRARGFTIPKMLEAGLIVADTVAFHATRNGVVAAPVAIYRPA